MVAALGLRGRRCTHDLSDGPEPTRWVEVSLGRWGRANVRLVYQVRDPSISLASFLQYKARDPTWYGRVPPAARLRADFEALSVLVRARGRLIVDCRHMTESYGQVVVSRADRGLRDPELVPAL